MHEFERDYLVIICDSLLRVGRQFQLEPLSFLYERDLQALLFADLFKSFANLGLICPQTACPWAKAAPGHNLTLNPVKSEYPGRPPKSAQLRDRPFDLAIIAPDLKRSERGDPALWHLWVRAAIEIKLLQANEKRGGIRTDQEKLEQYRKKANAEGRPFVGICAVFCYLDNDKRLRELIRGGSAHNPKKIVLDVNEVATVSFSPEGLSSR